MRCRTNKTVSGIQVASVTVAALAGDESITGAPEVILAVHAREVREVALTLQMSTRETRELAARLLVAVDATDQTEESRLVSSRSASLATAPAESWRAVSPAELLALPAGTILRVTNRTRDGTTVETCTLDNVEAREGKEGVFFGYSPAVEHGRERVDSVRGFGYASLRDAEWGVQVVEVRS